MSVGQMLPFAHGFDARIPFVSYELPVQTFVLDAKVIPDDKTGGMSTNSFRVHEDPDPPEASTPIGSSVYTLSPNGTPNIRVGALFKIHYIPSNFDDKVAGTVKLKVKNSRQDDVYDVNQPLAFEAAFSGTEDTFRVYTDSSIHLWQGRSNVGCNRGNDPTRVPAGTYYVTPYDANYNFLTKFPQAWKFFTKTKYLPTPFKIRWSCPSGSNQILTEMDRVAQTARPKLKGPASNPEKTPITVADVQISGVHFSEQEVYRPDGPGHKAYLVSFAGESSSKHPTHSVQLVPESERRFLTPTVRDKQSQKPVAFYETERIMLEFIAQQVSKQTGAIKYKNGSKFDNDKIYNFGKIVMYVDKETCQYCAELAWQVRDMLPNVDLIWIDNTRSKDNQMPSGNYCF